MQLFINHQQPTTNDALKIIAEHVRKLEQLVIPISRLRPTATRPDRTGMVYADEIDTRLTDIGNALEFVRASSNTQDT